MSCSLDVATIQGRHLFKEILVQSSTGIAPFYTLALKPVSTFKGGGGVAKPHHVYRKWFPKHIRGFYTAALNQFETV